MPKTTKPIYPQPPRTVVVEPDPNGRLLEQYAR